MSNKLCSNCGHEKSLDEFRNRRDSRDGKASECKKCAKARDKAGYNKKRRLAWNSARYDTLMEQVREFKRANGCSLCDESEECCLDFHHVESDTKEETISRMVALGNSWERIQSEMEKCILVCSNCHRKLHAGVLTLTG